MQSNVAFFVTVFCVSASTQITHSLLYSCDLTYIPYTFFTPCWDFFVGLLFFLCLGRFFANTVFAKYSAFSSRWFVCGFAFKFLGVVVLKVETSWVYWRVSSYILLHGMYLYIFVGYYWAIVHSILSFNFMMILIWSSAITS